MIISLKVANTIVPLIVKLGRDLELSDSYSVSTTSGYIVHVLYYAQDSYTYCTFKEVFRCIILVHYFLSESSSDTAVCSV